MSASAPAASSVDKSLFVFLDRCHLDIQQKLEQMMALATALEEGELTPALQAQARALTDWFNAEPRQHHLDEEKHVFPSLLASNQEDVLQATHRLIQDHGWLEADWFEIEPALEAAADGNSWFDPNVLRQAVEVFQQLYMSITTVGIIGAGTMGNGIAQACAVSRASTSSWSTSRRPPCKKAWPPWLGQPGPPDQEGKDHRADKDAALACIKGSTSYDDLKAAQLVIEAATENYELKLKILKQVDAIVGPEVIIATNTSSISITKLAAATSRADKLHRHALLQPRADDGAGGDHPRPADQRRHARRRQGHGRGAGQEPHHREERARASWSTASWCR
jgi:hypothetical protein